MCRACRDSVRHPEIDSHDAHKHILELCERSTWQTLLPDRLLNLHAGRHKLHARTEMQSMPALLADDIGYAAIGLEFRHKITIAFLMLR